MPEVSLMLEAIASLPVFVEQIAIPQVGDAGTAELTKTSEGCRVRAETEAEVDPIASSLQQCAVVWRP
jgi:hypothetical protein